MLLNFSNHPSHQWPRNQMQTAVTGYGSVQDLPFPQINPEWNSDQVLQLVEAYETEIRQINPAAVHIMGELTFTYMLVNKLTSIGIPCVASTTKRNVKEEKSIKTSVFEFVKFRSY